MEFIRKFFGFNRPEVTEAPITHPSDPPEWDPMDLIRDRQADQTSRWSSNEKPDESYQIFSSFHDGYFGPKKLPDPTEARTPRDLLLKEPDSNMTEQQHSQDQDTACPCVPSLSPAPPVMLNELASLMESMAMLQNEMMGSMFGNPPLIFDHGSSELDMPYLPGSSNPARENLLKKEDGDIDDEIQNANSLLKAGPPSYSTSDGSPAGPEAFLSPPALGTTLRSSSTTFSRIIRPDGSVEERRTYRDSSGKEEVTVTEIEAPEGGQPVPQLSPQDPFSRPDSIFGSIFKDFFR